MEATPRRRHLLITLGLVAVVSGLLPAAAGPQWTISGRVTTPDGQPVQDACVWFYPPAGDRFGIVQTDADGLYRFSGTGSRTLRVLFQDCRLSFGVKRFVSEWWNDAASFASATAIRTPQLDEDGDDISGIDAVVSAGHGIAGTVRAADSGAPLANVCVDVAPIPVPPVYGRQEFPMEAKTDSQGRYRVGVLSPGDYSVAFEDCNANPVYLSEVFDGIRNGSPTPVTLTSSQDTTGIDASLDLGAIIRGTLRDTAAQPISSACATAYDAAGREVDTDRTSSQGIFELTRLDTGTYRVGFIDCAGQGYIGEFYDDAATLAGATPIALTAGQVRTGVTAILVHCSDVDADADGLSLCDEIRLGSDPFDADTDGDGLSDGVEYHTYGTSPVDADTDHDRLDDGDEVTTYGADPLRVDTDGDQFSDGTEVHGGTCVGGVTVPGGSDPTNALSTPLLPGPEIGPGVALPSAPLVLCR
ncbi:MAG TPA: hypothetical protein VGB52_00920 [Actinomycetota bacterium]